MNKNYFKLFLSNLILTPIVLQLANTTLNLKDTPWFMFLLVAYVVSVVILGLKTFDTDNNVDLDNKTASSSFKKCAITLIVVFSLVIYGNRVSKDVAVFHNTAVQLNGNYDKKTLALPTFYDMMWKTYKQKENIGKLSEKTFIEVSKILMENRKDGANLSWKWVQENQNIPFEEFTSFYHDLSRFIESKRAEYYALELERQAAAIEYNVFLDTFPNNLYNVVLGKSHIEYSAGFTSDSTNKVFSTKIENL